MNTWYVFQLELLYSRARTDLRLLKQWGQNHFGKVTIKIE